MRAERLAQIPQIDHDVFGRWPPFLDFHGMPLRAPGISKMLRRPGVPEQTRWSKTGRERCRRVGPFCGRKAS